MEFAQSGNFPNGRADGKRLDMGNVSDDVKVHQSMLSMRQDVELPSNVRDDARPEARSVFLRRGRSRG